MALIEWNDEDFSVGSAEIDEQHKKWVKIINDLHDALTAKDETVIRKLCVEMADYTNYHFDGEEKLMEKVSYPGLGLHKEMHDQFQVNIIKRILRVYAGEVEISRQILNEIKSWLENHILNEDKKYSAYLLTEKKP
jgi:hemerythrin